MSRHKVYRNLIVMTKFHKPFDPDSVASATDRRTAHAESGVHLFDRLEGFLEQSKILLHVRIFPKSGKIRFIPYFNRPRHHLVRTVSVTQMSQKSLYQRSPIFIRLRRCSISLPVKYRLDAACKLFRHKSQFQKRS